MDLKLLEYFVSVAELGIAQPALSRQVRLMEVELRQKLLIRNGRSIVHQVALAREKLSAARGALTGRVSIGLPQIGILFK